MEIGATIGSVIATTSSGYLSEHGPAGGWPSVFYVSGVISLIAFVLWYSYSQSDPTDHPDISETELKYIQSNEFSSSTDDQNNSLYYSSDDNVNEATVSNSVFPSSTSSSSSIPAPQASSSHLAAYNSSLHLTARSDVKSIIVSGPSCHGNSYGLSESRVSRAPSNLSNRPSVPWRLIITSPPVLSIFVSKFSLSFSYFTLLSKLPSYLHDVLHIPPTQVNVLATGIFRPHTRYFFLFFFLSISCALFHSPFLISLSSLPTEWPFECVSLHDNMHQFINF